MASLLRPWLQLINCWAAASSLPGTCACSLLLLLPAAARQFRTAADLDGKSTALSQYTTALQTACTAAAGRESMARSATGTLCLSLAAGPMLDAASFCGVCPSFHSATAIRCHMHRRRSPFGTGWRRRAPPAWRADPAPHLKQTGRRRGGAAGRGEGQLQLL